MAGRRRFRTYSVLHGFRRVSVQSSQANPRSDADQINTDDEDLLISGSTAYEDIASDAPHQNAREQILAIWQSTTKSRTVRESSISSGVGTTGQGGPFRLDATMVFDDSAIDDLTYDSVGTGSPVDDWLMGDTDDVATPQSLPPVDDPAPRLSLASLGMPSESQQQVEARLALLATAAESGIPGDGLLDLLAWGQLAPAAKGPALNEAPLGDRAGDAGGDDPVSLNECFEQLGLM